MPDLVYGSVCSGIEAATVAWEPLGWKAAFFSEIEKFPCAVLAHHYPDTPNLGDMTKYRDWGLEHGAIDLLVGGTPCQDYSVAGLRAGLDGERGSLSLVFSRIAYKSGARWLAWENVPGVFSTNNGRDFGAILATFSGHHGLIFAPPDGGWRNSGIVKPAGPGSFGLAWRVLDAQHFGVPQRRRRVFVVGHLGDWRPAAAVLFERQSLSGDTPPRREKGEKPAPTISARTKGGGGLGTDFDCDGGLVAHHTTGAGKWSEGCGCLRARENDSHENLVTHSLRGEGFDASEDGTGRGTPLVMAHGQGNAEVCRDGSPSLTCNHEAPIVAIQERAVAEGDCGPGGKGWRDDGVAYTLEARHKVQAVAVRLAQTGANGGEAVCFHHQNSASCGVGVSEVAPSLQTDKEPAVCFHRNASCAVTPQDDKTAAIKSGGEHSYQFLQTASTVRRLTPRECERLQGFPDDYTLIPWRKGIAPDGPRYKALGNSMAVPVMRWIGERIQLVELILNGGAAAY